MSLPLSPIKIFVSAFIGLVAATALPRVGRAQMAIDRLDGPVTPHEIESFVAYLPQVKPATADGSSGNQAANLANEYAQGHSGENCKAMGLMYEISGNPAILDRLIYFCDVLLSQRNDRLAAPHGQVVYWSGKVDPIWNSGGRTPDGSSASGDGAGHLANCARLILQHPALWKTVVPDGDRWGNGATYLARAKTYVREADRCFDAHYFPYDLDLSDKNYLKYSAASPYQPGNFLPWNQVMMITYPLQYLAAAHELLGDDPARVAKYDTIVRVNLTRFFDDPAVRRIYTDAAGRTAYNWAYTPSHQTGEDSNHGALDVAGFCRAYACGRYGITAAQMTPFANMVCDVLTGTIGSNYHGRVDGTDGKGHGAPTKYLRGGYFLAAEFRPDAYYDLVKGLHLTAPGQTTSLEVFSRLMWVKDRRAHLGPKRDAVESVQK